jgi:hypothetical protein
LGFRCGVFGCQEAFGFVWLASLRRHVKKCHMPGGADTAWVLQPGDQGLAFPVAGDGEAVGTILREPDSNSSNE